MTFTLKTTRILALGLLCTTPASAQVLEANSDATIRGALCVGSSCADDPTPNFVVTPMLSSTVMLNEIRTRIDFIDTSDPNGDFPSNDWSIKANEDEEFERNQLAFLDLTAGTTPFIVVGKAPTNSLFVAADGKIGMGTSIPEAALHVSVADTPRLRLEQQNAGIASPQIWDVAGNENALDFVNVTDGAVPFSVTTFAPDRSLVVDNNGNIGFGVTGAEASLHVLRDDSTAKLLIEDTGTDFNTQIEIRKVGTPRFRFDDTRFDFPAPSGNQLPAEWDLGLDNNRDFILRNIETNFNVFKVLKTGDMVLEGALTQNSDKNAKMAIVPIDAGEVLAKVEALPIATWSYKDTENVRHIGPMAQDFRALFGTGASDTGISTLDTSGVALAAIKALSEDNKALVTEVKTLSQQNAAQQTLITQLAARLEALEGQIAK